MGWKVNINKQFKCDSPIFIEGLPGIGNVGKIVVDYLIDLTNAKKIGTIWSKYLPNSVFVNEKNLVTLPKLELYYIRKNKQDFLFLTGDAQPSLESASYELTDLLLEIVNNYNCKNIITLGGIGLSEVPEDPQVFVTGNNKEFISEFKKLGADPKLFGIVGPIIGVSGLLLGLSKNYKIKAASLLGETFGHPMYIGLKESKKILELLDKKYSFKLNLTELNEEISIMEEELASDEEIPKSKSKKIKKLRKYQELGYIG